MTVQWNGTQLKRLRDAKGSTQTVFAKAIGMHPSDISKYERGQKNPNPDTVQRFADHFDVKTEVFYRGTVTGRVNATVPSKKPQGSIDPAIASRKTQPTEPEEITEEYAQAALKKSLESNQIILVDRFHGGSLLVKFEGKYYRASLEELR